MIVCPVCEHAQESGDECAVCGQRLAGGPPAAEPAEPLEGLEPTRFAGVEGEGERLLELERTEFARAPDAPVEPLELDSERAEAVDAEAGGTDGLEPTRVEAIPADPLAPSAPLSCRYCRTPVPPTDAFCPRCGMRLPRSPSATALAEPAAAPCSSCGTPSREEVCRACGARRNG